jgi:hypothetical protein
MEQKRILSFMICIVLLFGLNSCIKDEALNTEADVEQASILNGDLVLSTAPSIGNNTIIFKLKRFSGSYMHAPEFVVTTGATILPESGTELDFSVPHQYTVTSQDGAWSKTYTVSFVLDEGADFYAAFENAQIVDSDNPVGHYHQFFELTAKGQKNFIWETANEGYNILAGTLVGEDEELVPSFYPTSQVTDGYLGQAAKLITKDTGPLGGMFGSPLAAGNLFVGEFKLTFPTVNSTRFGIPYNSGTAPISLKGFFKYKAGEKFVANTKPSQLTKDTWDGYAILFEKSPGLDHNFLTGTHGFKDARIVSVARIGAQQQIETDKWTAFEVPFSFVNGKSFDPSKEYMYTIVFSSSKEGDMFNGAVGSTLYIDEVELVTNQIK